LVLGLGGLFGAFSAIGGGRLADRIGHKPVVLVARSARRCCTRAGLGSDGMATARAAHRVGAVQRALIPSTQALSAWRPRQAARPAFGIAASAPSLGSSRPADRQPPSRALGIRAVFVVTAILLFLACLYIARLRGQLPATTDDCPVIASP
jgi:predicted MFS family arabinose efflux permease